MPLTQQEPAIALYVLGPQNNGATFSLSVSLSGFPQGKRVKLSFVEVNRDADDGASGGAGDEGESGDQGGDRVLGTLSGTVVAADGGKAFSYSFVPDQSPPAPPRDSKVKVAFLFAKPAALKPGASAPEMAPIVFPISDDAYDAHEGDRWEIQVREENAKVASHTVPLARIRRQLEGKPCTYDWHDGHAIQLYHDGSGDDRGTCGAFFDLDQAIEDAQHFVFIVDWSFQPMHRMTRSNAAHPANSIGARLVRKAAAKKDFLVAIHTWNHTVGASDRDNDDGAAILDSIAKGLGLGLHGRPANLLWRATSREGIGWSHHQKFVVMDCEGKDGADGRDLKVFFGGLDLTKGRFDWPGHHVSPKQGVEIWPFVQRWNTLDGKHVMDDWYNAEFEDEKDRLSLPRQPWHDIYMCAQGPCGWDFVREFVGRWTRTPSLGGNKGDTSASHVELVWNKYRQLREDRTTFVQQYDGIRKGAWALQVYRSLSSAHWAPPDRKPKDTADETMFAEVTWRRKLPKAEDSIASAYHRAIEQAERFIYIENQYLIGSGLVWQGERSKVSNDVPRRIVKKILAQAKAGKPFHVYIVKPMFPEGNPVGLSGLEIRKNEWLTAQYMVRTLADELGKAWTDYLSFYFLANWKPQANPTNSGHRKHRVRENDRYMVYVHSKLMIIDDRYFILGSANLNERSLNGDRDSEIACGVWPGTGQADGAAKMIRELRLDLWKSHFGPALVAPETPEAPACVSNVLTIGDGNYAAFRTLSAPPNGLACRWPYQLDTWRNLMVGSGKLTGAFDEDKLLPDSPNAKKDWQWDSPGSVLLGWLRPSLAE